jgi:hypothetical protein
MSFSDSASYTRNISEIRWISVASLMRMRRGWDKRIPTRKYATWDEDVKTRMERWRGRNEEETETKILYDYYDDSCASHFTHSGFLNGTVMQSRGKEGGCMDKESFRELSSRLQRFPRKRWEREIKETKEDRLQRAKDWNDGNEKGKWTLLQWTVWVKSRITSLVMQGRRHRRWTHHIERFISLHSSSDPFSQSLPAETTKIPQRIRGNGFPSRPLFLIETKRITEESKMKMSRIGKTYVKSRIHETCKKKQRELHRK